jgi:hypothetical protein
VLADTALEAAEAIALANKAKEDAVMVAEIAVAIVMDLVERADEAVQKAVDEQARRREAAADAAETAVYAAAEADVLVAEAEAAVAQLASAAAQAASAAAQEVAASAATSAAFISAAIGASHAAAAAELFVQQAEGALAAAAIKMAAGVAALAVEDLNLLIVQTAEIIQAILAASAEGARCALAAAAVAEAAACVAMVAAAKLAAKSCAKWALQSAADAMVIVLQTIEDVAEACKAAREASAAAALAASMGAALAVSVAEAAAHQLAAQTARDAAAAANGAAVAARRMGEEATAGVLTAANDTAAATAATAARAADASVSKVLARIAQMMACQASHYAEQHAIKATRAVLELEDWLERMSNLTLPEALAMAAEAAIGAQAYTEILLRQIEACIGDVVGRKKEALRIAARAAMSATYHAFNRLDTLIGHKFEERIKALVKVRQQAYTQYELAGDAGRWAVAIAGDAVDGAKSRTRVAAKGATATAAHASGWAHQQVARLLAAFVAKRAAVAAEVPRALAIEVQETLCRMAMRQAAHMAVAAALRAGQWGLIADTAILQAKDVKRKMMIARLHSKMQTCWKCMLVEKQCWKGRVCANCSLQKVLSNWGLNIGLVIWPASMQLLASCHCSMPPCDRLDRLRGLKFNDVFSVAFRAFEEQKRQSQRAEWVYETNLTPLTSRWKQTGSLIQYEVLSPIDSPTSPTDSVSGTWGDDSPGASGSFDFESATLASVPKGITPPETRDGQLGMSITVADPMERINASVHKLENNNRARREEKRQKEEQLRRQTSRGTRSMDGFAKSRQQPTSPQQHQQQQQQQRVSSLNTTTTSLGRINPAVSSSYERVSQQRTRPFYSKGKAKEAEQEQQNSRRNYTPPGPVFATKSRFQFPNSASGDFCTNTSAGALPSVVTSRKKPRDTVRVRAFGEVKVKHRHVIPGASCIPGASSAWGQISPSSAPSASSSSVAWAPVDKPVDRRSSLR